MYARRTLLVSFAILLLAAVPLFAAGRPILACYGDSITAGYGLPDGVAYSDFLQNKLNAAGSGATDPVPLPASVKFTL